MSDRGVQPSSQLCRSTFGSCGFGLRDTEGGPYGGSIAETLDPSSTSSHRRPPLPASVPGEPTSRGLWRKCRNAMIQAHSKNSPMATHKAVVLRIQSWNPMLMRALRDFPGFHSVGTICGAKARSKHYTLTSSPPNPSVTDVLRRAASPPRTGGDAGRRRLSAHILRRGCVLSGARQRRSRHE